MGYFLMLRVPDIVAVKLSDSEVPAVLFVTENVPENFNVPVAPFHLPAPLETFA